ncbi:hypothetical protein [Streptomyces sp. NPDC004435]|uniref:hypothetical protein n=1 Tax=Streptomyces sp. NPDC004435 TaxID=3364701 RepID=UPI0036AA2019
MEPLPTPCPAPLVPDATGAGSFDAAYRRAKSEQAVLIAIESQGAWWTVKADTLTADPEHTVDDAVTAAARDAVMRLVAAGEVRSDAYAGPVYYVLHGLESEERAREIAAALHAALYGDLRPLTAAVPAAP